MYSVLSFVLVKVRDSDVLACVRGQRKMSQVLGAFGLLDFTMLRPVLAWRTFWNLRTVYFFNFTFLRLAAQTAYAEWADTGAQMYKRYYSYCDSSHWEVLVWLLFQQLIFWSLRISVLKNIFSRKYLVYCGRDYNARNTRTLGSNILCKASCGWGWSIYLIGSGVGWTLMRWMTSTWFQYSP
jgi:hypothetical protein